MSQNYPDLKLLIGGEWVSKDGRKHEPVMNPATGECIGVLPHASKADLDRALDAAEQAYPVWRGMSPQDRGKILKRAADLLHERAEHIARIATIDGLRADFTDGWGLIRASNTTPVLVLRFEAENEAALARIRALFKAQLDLLLPGREVEF